MTRSTPARALALAGLIASAAALTACGKMGDLERPQPLFGRNAQAGNTQASQQNGRSEDPTRPVQTVDPRQESTLSAAPPRSDPISGQGQNPNAVAPQGALPDPYARPQ